LLSAAEYDTMRQRTFHVCYYNRWRFILLHVIGAKVQKEKLVKQTPSDHANVKMK